MIETAEAVESAEELRSAEPRTPPAGHQDTPERVGPVLGEKWIPRDPHCLASVRRFVRDVAADWAATEDVQEIVELLASELVTNAITHGSVGVPDTSTVRVTVSRDRDLLVVDVHDSCSALPRPRQAGDYDLRGRGLAIVQMFSHRWGWELTPYGKTVWFQLLAWR